MKSRIFFSTFAVANLGLIAYGILALFRPEILLAPFLTKVYQLPAEAAQATAYLLGLCRLLGYLNVAPGMLGLLILYLYWRTRQAWFLKLLVAATILVYLGPVTFDNTVGTIGPLEVIELIIFAMVIISGFIMLKHSEMVS